MLWVSKMGRCDLLACLCCGVISGMTLLDANGNGSSVTT